MRIGQKPSLVFALRAAKLPKNAPGVFVSMQLTPQLRKKAINRDARNPFLNCLRY